MKISRILIGVGAAVALTACASGPAREPGGSALPPLSAVGKPLPRPQAAFSVTPGYFLYAGPLRGRPLPPPRSMRKHVVYETMVESRFLNAVQFTEHNCGVPIDTQEISAGAKMPPLEFSGTCSGLLAAASQSMGYAVTYRMGEEGIEHARIVREITRTFQLPILGESTKSSATVSAKNSTGGNGSAGGTAGGTQSMGTASSKSSVATSQSYDADVWKGILSEARAVAMPAMLTADPSTATVTITGSRTDVDRFARWVRNVSRRLQRQVQINIHVYTVTLNNDSNYGLAPSVIWKYLKGLNSVSITAPSALELASGATPSTIQFSAGHGPFSGTQAAVNALSQVGSVRQVYSNSLLGLNGHVVTVNDATNYGYLAESSGNSAIAGANTYGSQTLMPGNISAGAAIRVLPRVADDNRIVLSIVFRYIGTPTFKTITSGTESIQIPQDPETAFNQTLDMQSGQTVMLLGFKNQQDSKTLEGTGSPKFWLFGGGRMHERQRSITVVTVTATAS
ncbi:MAG: hypothetical protein ACYCT1_13590 [Steroidobacteraceae bacterium]